MKTFTVIEAADINRAVADYLAVGWTEESVKCIREVYGDTVFTAISEICSFAVNSPIWSYDNKTLSYEETIKNLGEYSFLTEEAKVIISNIASDFWK